MKKNETKVVCPKCGAEFKIAEQTHISVGVVIGKDAGLGTIHPEVVGNDKPKQKIPNKAADRIEALKKAGVDVRNMAKGPAGFFLNLKRPLQATAQVLKYFLCARDHH